MLRPIRLLALAFVVGLLSALAASPAQGKEPIVVPVPGTLAETWSDETYQMTFTRGIYTISGMYSNPSFISVEPLHGAPRSRFLRTEGNLNYYRFGTGTYRIQSTVAGLRVSGGPVTISLVRLLNPVGYRYESLRASPAMLRGGTPTTISASPKLVLDDGSVERATVGTPFSLQQRSDTGEWTDAKRGAVDQAGEAVATVVPSNTTQWRLAVAGWPPSQALTVAVDNRAKVTLWTPKSATWNRPVSLRGAVTLITKTGKVPAAKGQEITIQFRRNATWEWTDVQDTLVQGRGRFRTTVTPRATGQWRAVAADARSRVSPMTVRSKTRLVVEWPQTVNGSFRVPVRLEQNGEWLGTGFTLHYRASGYDRWEPIDRQWSKPNWSVNLLVNYYRVGYYKVCAPQYRRCSIESYA